MPLSLQLKKLKPLSNIRLSVIGGLIISQLCVLEQSSDLLFIEALSAGIIFALLIILVVLVQDLVNTVSIASLFYFWLLFLFSRAPLVPIIHNDDGIKEVVRISHFVSFILALFGFVLECFPLKFDEQALLPPEAKCSHASILLFGWLNPLFLKGLNEPLSKEKIPSLQLIFQ